MLLRLNPGDPGYNSWELALREFKAEVERVLCVHRDVARALDAPDAAAFAASRQAFQDLAKRIIDWPIMESVL